MIAQTLGLQEQGRQPIATQLRTYLRERCMLLVLDNFEQVIGAATSLVELLMVCPGVTALVTSRATLQVRGEHLLPMPPLPVPNLTALPPTDVLVTNPAVALFVERARAVVPSFAITEEDIQSIAAICMQLDGLPLAIERVAVRVRILPPAALLARLTPRLVLLTSEARDLPQRHRTLRHAIAWSYNLLNTGEQVLSVA